MDRPLLRLADQHNRVMNYLRISVTDRCNLRCLYCLPNDIVPNLNHDDILNHEEILRVAGGENLAEARRLRFNPIKIKGINEDEILDFARLSLGYPYHIRFIEHMPIGRPLWIICSITSRMPRPKKRLEQWGN